jgi:hypothetical protein
LGAWAGLELRHWQALLGSLPLLQHLEVANATLLGDAALRCVARLKGMRELWLSNFPKVTGEGLQVRLGAEARCTAGALSRGTEQGH